MPKSRGLKYSTGDVKVLGSIPGTPMSLALLFLSTNAQMFQWLKWHANVIVVWSEKKRCHPHPPPSKTNELPDKFWICYQDNSLTCKYKQFIEFEYIMKMAYSHFKWDGSSVQLKQDKTKTKCSVSVMPIGCNASAVWLVPLVELPSPASCIFYPINEWRKYRRG